MVGIYVFMFGKEKVGNNIGSWMCIFEYLWFWYCVNILFVVWILYYSGIYLLVFKSSSSVDGGSLFYYLYVVNR